MRFERGIFLGKAVDTNENVFGSANGPHASRTMKRLLLSMQVDVEMAKNMVGVP